MSIQRDSPGWGRICLRSLSNVSSLSVVFSGAGPPPAVGRPKPPTTRPTVRKTAVRVCSVVVMAWITPWVSAASLADNLGPTEPSRPIVIEATTRAMPCTTPPSYSERGVSPRFQSPALHAPLSVAQWRSTLPTLALHVVDLLVGEAVEKVLVADPEPVQAAVAVHRVREAVVAADVVVVQLETHVVDNDPVMVEQVRAGGVIEGQLPHRLEGPQHVVVEVADVVLEEAAQEDVLALAPFQRVGP